MQMHSLLLIEVSHKYCSVVIVEALQQNGSLYLPVANC